jgi:hypothetical protein
MLAVTFLALGIIQPVAVNSTRPPDDVMTGGQSEIDDFRMWQQFLLRMADSNREFKKTREDIDRLMKESRENLDKIEQMQKARPKK